VYNLIGHNVRSVFLGEEGAGYYQKTWDASSFSSGIYVHELTATDASNKQTVSRKRMAVLKEGVSEENAGTECRRYG
jgi:Zn-dependent oligopeptidase